jgi:hypothetical protein
MPDIKSEKVVVMLELDLSPAPAYRDDQIVKSIDEGDDIIEFISENPGPHYATDLAKRFGIAKNKVGRILKTYHKKRRIAPVIGVENGWGATKKGRRLALGYSNIMSRYSQIANRESIIYEPGS